MAGPAPLGKIYPQFQLHLATIAGYSSAAYSASVLAGQRMWHLPPLSVPDKVRCPSPPDCRCIWDGDPWSWVDMIDVWTRDEINADYMTIIGQPKRKLRSGEAMVVKLQMDYIATMERAFRTRHSSSVRCRLHAAKRRQGHGSGTGPLQGTMTSWLSRLLEAAYDDPLGEELLGTGEEESG